MSSTGQSKEEVERARTSEEKYEKHEKHKKHKRKNKKKQREESNKRLKLNSNMNEGPSDVNEGPSDVNQETDHAGDRVIAVDKVMVEMAVQTEVILGEKVTVDVAVQTEVIPIEKVMVEMAVQTEVIPIEKETQTDQTPGITIACQTGWAPACRMKKKEKQKKKKKQQQPSTKPFVNYNDDERMIVTPAMAKSRSGNDKMARKFARDNKGATWAQFRAFRDKKN